MPPPYSTTGRSWIPIIGTLNSHSCFSLGLPLIAIVVLVCLRLAIRPIRNQRRMATMKDCSQQTLPITPPTAVEKSRSSEDCTHQKLPITPPSSGESRIVEQQPPSPETSQPYQPTYPWQSPPKLLPTPYEAQYPFPTIQRHATEPSPSSSSTTRRHSSADSPPEDVTKQTTTFYTRRVSTDSFPAPSSVTLHGTVTTSHKGWRRKTWVVTGTDATSS
ncbi:hypothetical protein M011DRAFT_98306 [Sporormia fimetaria CBS 119925]|uniref:Uncharacterized protein n=1 Tax=Sporormia fimetaria CBS 119925 TaxID=1340428 RepID=A0A6A6V691_9PLEO|nr:hypothetical protein M011DRAFT_98306 [Sporormia fimetaria CBS 119925]